MRAASRSATPPRRSSPTRRRPLRRPTSRSVAARAPRTRVNPARPRRRASAVSARSPSTPATTVPVDHRADVTLGGGRARFEQPLDNGKGNVVDYAKAKGFQYVTDAAGLAGVKSVQKGPGLGLFNASNNTTEFAPLIGAPTPGAGGPEFRCDENFRPAHEPRLGAMTKKAIELLKEDRDGFFLQVESASIDKRDHASDLCGQIGETKQLDDAVKEALAFQKRNPDTL